MASDSLFNTVYKCKTTMIEFCTKKRMAIAIVILISVSIVTVVVESKWSTHHRINKDKGLKETVSLSENTSLCADGKEIVVESCFECNKLELKSEKPYCQETGYKSRIRCSNGNQFFKSCPTITWQKEKKFLLFECLTFITGVSSFGVLRYRQKRLDYLLIEKINRQIASGL